MAKKSPDPASMFDKLAQAREAKESEQPITSETVGEPDPKRKGRPKGKRSNPDYTQVGAYIPIALEKQVKRLLIDEEMDFSDLVAQLLEDWVKQHSR